MVADIVTIALFFAMIPTGLAAQDPDVDVEDVAQSTSSPTSASLNPDDPEVAEELKIRRVLEPGVERGSPEDAALLVRIREAQTMGALDLLREHVVTLRGYAVRYKSGGAQRRLWLTKAGFQKYQFLKSQLARKYFEDRGTDAKFAFQLRDLNGKRLFDGKGNLTRAGDALYNRIRQGLPCKWRNPNGEEVGNTRPASNK